MHRKLLKRCIPFFLSVLLAITILPTIACAASSTVCDDKIKVESNLGTVSTGTDQIVTINNKINGLNFGTNYTFTITNIGSTPASIQFDYSGTSFDTFGLSERTGTYPKTKLTVDESITITASSKCGIGGQNDTLTLSNFVYEEEAVPKVTVNFDSTMGSVTIDGITTTSGTGVSVGGDLTATLVAKAASGKVFLAWADASGNLLSTASNYTVALEQDTTYQALFGNASVVNYMVGNAVYHTTTDAYHSLDTDKNGDKDTEYTYYTVTPAKLFTDLNAAISATDAKTNNVIVALNSGSVPAGNYTIPAGVTFLIPFDGEKTMYTSVPGFIYSDNRGIGSNYCKLTLSSGANITVNGAISLSTAAHSADGGECLGYPAGDYSLMVMENGSTITVNNGGVLYAWGFITAGESGYGTITAKSGATIYENFQLADYRGGRQSSSMKNSVFAASQYYVQNVEVPLTLEAGSEEYCATWVNLLSTSYRDTLTLVPFVASNGLFDLTSGSLTKTYDGTTDRLIVDFSGTASINSVALNIGQGLMSVATIDSASYVLGINNNMTINLNSGSLTLNQSVALQPGSQLYIEEGATCILSNGVKAFVYDGDQWGNFCYSGGSDVKFVSIPYAPGRSYTRTAADLKDASVCVNGTLDASVGYLYTTEGNADIHSTSGGTIKMNNCAATNAYQYSQASDAYTTYPVTSAKLKNGSDGTFLSSSANTYTYTDGYWHCEKHTGVDTDHICDVCGYETVCADTDGDFLCDVCGVTICDHANTEVQNAKEATCTEDGYSGDTVCTTCKTTVKTGTVITAAGSHSGGTATCTEQAMCDICGQKYGDALGHTYADPVVNFSDDGATYTVTVTCSECAEGTKDRIKTSEEKNSTVQSTTSGDCQTNSTTTYEASGEFESVAYSGTKLVEGELGTHNPGAEATCTTAQTCTVCGAELVPALNHKDDDKDHVCDNKCGVEQGTHADSGTDGDHVCDYGCGAVLEDCADVTTDDNHSCDVCGKENVTEHVYTEAVTPPTCTEDGFTTYTCNCGHTYTDNTVKAQHSIAQGAAQEKTCTQDGWEAYEYCTKCSHSTKVVIPAGHTLKFVEEKAASCTEAGNLAHWLCDVCGKCFEDEQAQGEIADVTVPATNHANTKTINASEATCGEDGYTGDTYCEDCGTTIATGTSIPATGAHEYDEGVVTQEPTATVPGVMTYTCGTCGDSYTEEIPVVAETITIIHDAKGNEVAGVASATVEYDFQTNATGAKILSLGVKEGETAAAEGKYVFLVKYTLNDEENNAEKETGSKSNFIIPDGAADITVESGMLGDVSKNGRLNAKDVAMLKDLVGSSIVDMAFVAGDISGNGRINAKDVAQLKDLV